MVEKLTLGDTHINALQYCAKGEMIETNMLTTDVNEQGKQMMLIAASRPGVGQTCMHFSLSGTQLDNEKLTTSDYQMMMREHLREGQGIDISKHQYSMFIHREGTGRAHIHCIINRISLDGKDHNLWNYKNKGKASCRALEQKYGLEAVTNERAPEKVKLTSEEVRQRERTGMPVAKENIAEAIERRIPEAGDLEELREALKQDDVGMEILYNSEGPYGLRFTGADPSTGTMLTFAGGGIANNCQCRAVISRIERAQQRAHYQQNHQDGKPLSPWQKLQASVKENIPGCRDLETLTTKLQEHGITLSINNNEASYTIDGNQYRGKLPRNATLAAINERLASNTAWQSAREKVRKAVKDAVKNADNAREVQELLALQGIVMTTDIHGEASYTVDGTTLSGRAIPRGCTAAEIQKRIDGHALYREINDVVTAATREPGATVDSVIEACRAKGIDVHVHRDPDSGQQEIKGYGIREFFHDDDGQLQTRTREFRDWIPTPLTIESIQQRIDSSELYRSVTNSVNTTIRKGGNLNAIRAQLQKQGIMMTVEKDPQTGARTTTYTNDKGITLNQDQIPRRCSVEDINARIAARQAAARKLAARNILTALAAGGRQEEEEDEYNRRGPGM